VKAPKAARLAAEKGYKNVFLYYEGMKGWGKAGYHFISREKLPLVKLPRIKPPQLKEMIETDPNIVMVDIRDNDLFNSIRFPYPNRLRHIRMVDLEEQKDTLPKGKKIIIVCHLGWQGTKAAPLLKRAGFNVIGALDGGIMTWQKMGFPVVYPKK
jgi:rhodanese-related sulfurtransferase